MPDGALAGTFTVGDTVTDVSGPVSLSAAYGDVSITGTVTATPRPIQVPSEFYDGTDATARLTAWLTALPAGAVAQFDPALDMLCQTAVKVTLAPDVTLRDVGLVRTDPERLVLKNGVWINPPGYVGAHLHLFNSTHPRIHGRYRVRSTNVVSDGAVGFGAYDDRFELAAGLRVEGGSGLRMGARLDVDGVWGDGIHIVKHNDFVLDLDPAGSVDRNGRQGITPNGIGGKIGGFRLLHGRRGGIDFEPATVIRQCGDIEVSGYDMMTRLLPFPAQGRGPVDNIWIHDGVTRGLSVPVLKIAASDGTRRSNWTLERHRSVYTLGSPSQAAVVADNVDGLTVRDCRLPVSAGASNRCYRSVAMKNAGGRTLIERSDFSPGGIYVVNATPLPGHVLDLVDVTPAQTVQP